MPLYYTYTFAGPFCPVILINIDLNIHAYKYHYDEHRAVREVELYKHLI